MRYHALTADLIQNAGHTARRFGHSYVGSAHLLVALTELPGGTGQFLRGLGIESELTGDMTQLLYGAGTPDLPLPQGFSRGARAILRTAAREAKAQASCIGGICALIMGEAPERALPCPDTGTIPVRLKKAYARAMHLLSACEGYRTDPEYGPVFQRLAIKQQEHCRKILEIIGSL